jgi:hypothetical protein
MSYGKLIIILRLFFYLYKFWYLYESNSEFVNQMKNSKTYNSIVSIHEYTNTIQECRNIDIKMPYMLRLSEFTMSDEATYLYKSVYKITQCIKDPEILAKRFMEFLHANQSYTSYDIIESKELQLYDPAFVIEINKEGLNDLYKMANDIEYFSKKLLLSNVITVSEYQEVMNEHTIRSPKKNGGSTNTNTVIITTRDHWYYVDIFMGATYEMSQETMNYFFYSPTHTPLYDKFTQIQQRLKSYYRELDESYRQMNYLAIDIVDELSLFTTKFHSSIQYTVNLYYSTGFLLTETVGFLYGSDETIFMIEGINMVRLQLE